MAAMLHVGVRSFCAANDAAVGKALNSELTPKDAKLRTDAESTSVATVIVTPACWVLT